MKKFTLPGGRAILLLVVAAILLLSAAAGCTTSNSKKETKTVGDSKEKGVVTVYSSRTEELIKPVFDEFTKETGIEVKFTTAKEEELHERLKSEGAKSPADILITVDAGNLWLASEAGLLQPVSSNVLEDNIPASLRDPDNEWFALTKRVRAIMYSTKKVKPEEFSTYEALGDAKWNGRLGLRTSGKVYNKSLIASMIANLGNEKTEAAIKGWIANKPVIFDSDTDLIKAIEAGQVDVGIANTYYLGRLLKEDSNYGVSLFWPNQKDRGAHVNVSGAGLTKHAPNKEGAVRLLEYMSQPKAQEFFGRENLEYPVNPKATNIHEILTSWGEFKSDDLNVAELGKNQAEAVKMADRADYR